MGQAVNSSDTHTHMGLSQNREHKWVGSVWCPCKTRPVPQKNTHTMHMRVSNWACANSGAVPLECPLRGRVPSSRAPLFDCSRRRTLVHSRKTHGFKSMAACLQSYWFPWVPLPANWPSGAALADAAQGTVQLSPGT